MKDETFCFSVELHILANHLLSICHIKLEICVYIYSPILYVHKYAVYVYMLYIYIYVIYIYILSFGDSKRSPNHYKWTDF